MTDARAKAVEAAVNEAACAFEDADRGVAYALRNIHTEAPMRIAITAYLATMAEAGWVMVRDVGEMDWRHTEGAAQGFKVNGWNACRAAMLKGSTDEQG